MLIETPGQPRAVYIVPLRPSRKVAHRSQQIVLVGVARPVGKHEIMPEIRGVPRPGHEVIDTPCMSRSPSVAIETVVSIAVQKYPLSVGERGPGLAEEEQSQLIGLTQRYPVLLPDFSNPRSADEIDDEPVEASETEHDTRPQGDLVASSRVLVQELVGLWSYTDNLQSPERLLLHDPLNAPDQRRPARTLSDSGERVSVSVPRRAEYPNHRSLLSCVLLERGLGRGVHAYLQPVQIDEPLGDFVGREAEWIVRVTAPCNGQISDRVQEGELVGGDEHALLQQPLKAIQELKLALR
jgi:hypothetical protein